MIQIDIVDYDNLSSLGMRITKYVNSNLRDRYLETQSENLLESYRAEKFIEIPMGQSL